MNSGGETSIQHLNKQLLLQSQKVSQTFQDITIRGELKECRPFRDNVGISFKIFDGNDSFSCKLWARNLPIGEITSREGTTCRVSGSVNSEFFYGHRFVLNVFDIEGKAVVDEPTFAEICQQAGMFDNKRPFDWPKIRKLGIVSKTDSQGYNDFVGQFKIPLEATVAEVILEGDKTSSSVIKAISQLQDQDAIIIVRGGGSVSNISMSFDTMELFNAMRKSKVPIITAIGHAEDTGDKLLITQVSDLDFSTPSTAAYEMNKLAVKPPLVLNPCFFAGKREIMLENIKHLGIISKQHHEVLIKSTVMVARDMLDVMSLFHNIQQHDVCCILIDVGIVEDVFLFKMIKESRVPVLTSLDDSDAILARVADKNQESAIGVINHLAVAKTLHVLLKQHKRTTELMTYEVERLTSNLKAELEIPAAVLTAPANEFVVNHGGVFYAVNLTRDCQKSGLTTEKFAIFDKIKSLNFTRADVANVSACSETCELATKICEKLEETQALVKKIAMLSACEPENFAEIKKLI